ncbi:MAG: hypothetical protein JSR46_09555, partial [Verrucomicrobia bacterium]|nr:hypothetical protein [Verrucomicrobiota bacterium]
CLASAAVLGVQGVSFAAEAPPAKGMCMGQQSNMPMTKEEQDFCNKLSAGAKKNFECMGHNGRIMAMRMTGSEYMGKKMTPDEAVANACEKCKERRKEMGMGAEI